jgi:hypothetical protein
MRHHKAGTAPEGQAPALVYLCGSAGDSIDGKGTMASYSAQLSPNEHTTLSQIA